MKTSISEVSGSQLPQKKITDIHIDAYYNIRLYIFVRRLSLYGYL